MLGNLQRVGISRTSKRTHFESLMLSVGDCVELCTHSINEKKVALSFSCAVSNFSCTTLFRKKSKVPNLLLFILRQLERAFSCRVKRLVVVGIKQQVSISHIHEEDRRAVHMKETLQHATKALLHDSGFHIT